MSSLPQDTGKTGEDIAVWLLQSKGYQIISRNFRSRFGEIDIIAIDGESLVFVEVKTRTNSQYGWGEEAITPKKLASIVKTGQFFRFKHPETPALMRVDVVSILLRNGKLQSIKHFKNIGFM